MLKEWPLVVFTIAGQTAVGMSLLVLLPLSFSTGVSWNAGSRGAVLTVLATIFGLLVGAAALSFFHLRHPFRARRVLANLRTSWLSREIFFELAFMSLVGLAYVLVRTGNAEVAFFRAAAGGAALMGILFLVSMSKLYMLESLPPWNQAYTGISFFLTAGALGAMGTAWIVGSPPSDNFSYSSYLWAVALFCVAGETLFAALLTPRYGIAGVRPEPSLRPPAPAARLLHLGRLAFLAGGLFLIVLATAIGAPGGPGGIASIPAGVAGHAARPLLTLALVLVLLGELSGRFLFYGLVPRPGD